MLCHLFVLLEPYDKNFEYPIDLLFGIQIIGYIRDVELIVIQYNIFLDKLEK
jgi:hypothetical protein